MLEFRFEELINNRFVIMIFYITVDLPKLEEINIRKCSEVVGKIVIANLKSLKKIMTYTRYDEKEALGTDVKSKYNSEGCCHSNKGRCCKDCSKCKKCGGNEKQCCKNCSDCTMCGKKLLCEYCSSHEVVIRNCETLEEIDLGDYSFYKFNSLSYDNLPCLRQLYIGSFCFRDIRQFCLHDQENLEYIEIGKESFVISLNNGRRESGLFLISRCKKLKELKINNFSFFDYSTMELIDLEALEIIHLGEGCFRYADLSLHSM